MYYPKSQIITNKFSKGELLNPLTKENYIGPYWKTSTGKFFSGKYPSKDVNQIELTKVPLGYDYVNKNYEELKPQFYNFTSKNLTYLNLKKIPSANAPGLPQYSPTLPQKQDYVDGEFTRFFCRKNNQYSYTEINEKIFNKLKNKDKSIDFNKFLCFTLPWVISGDKNQVATENKNAISYKEFKIGHKNLGIYLKENYLQFYK